METWEIVLFVFIIILILVGIGIGIYYLVKHDQKKNTGSSGGNNGGNSGGTTPPTLTPLPGPTGTTPPTLTPLPGPTGPRILTPLPAPPINTIPILNPLPNPPQSPIGVITNTYVQQIYNAITPTDNGAAAYNLLNQYDNQLMNSSLTPFEYGLVQALAYYPSVYQQNLTPSQALVLIQL